MAYFTVIITRPFKQSAFIPFYSVITKIMSTFVKYIHNFIITIKNINND